MPGHGTWTPALVTTSNAVLVPFSIKLTITSLTTGESTSFAAGKEAAERTATTACGFEQVFTNSQTGESHQVSGVLEVLSRPLG